MSATSEWPILTGGSGVFRKPMDRRNSNRDITFARTRASMARMQNADGQRQCNLKPWIWRESTLPSSTLRGVFRCWPSRTWNPEFAAALARAYNNWLYDFCEKNPNRLLGAGMISPFDIDEAVVETKRCVKELGFRAIFMRSNITNGRNWYDDYYEPLWSLLEELEIPLGFHESSSTAGRQIGDNFEPNFMLRRIVAQPMEQMLGLVSLCSGGVLARHPKLRVAFLEANCTWLPWLLWRLDEGWEREGDVWAKDLAMAPSEYFKRQVFVSVEPDEAGVKYVIDYIGTDRLVFSTDYPHGDSKFPHAVESFLKLEINQDDKRKILWDNCAEFYHVTT